MGLEDLEVDIRKKVESQVRAIIADAEGEAEKIVSKSKLQLSELKKAREAEIGKITSEYINREIAQAQLNARKEKLNAKKVAIEGLFARIDEKLLQLNAADKKEVLSALIEKAKKELPDARYVYSNKGDKDIASGLCTKAGLSFGGIVDCKGGIVVENADSEVRLDYTYEALLADFRKEVMKDVAAQLFGGK